MKRWSRLLVSLLTCCMLFGLMAVEAFAAEPYTYTVNLYAGNKGTVNGLEKVPKAKLSAGSNVDFSDVEIVVTDHKYYPKGIRRSGWDNDEVFFNTMSFSVDGDMDYVVAYGVTAKKVAYTVNYQNAAGEVLLPSNTYYGDIGDKPVIAYQYIKNYIPQALAMTGTLKENAAENVFTFVYTPGASDTIITNTEVITIPGGTTTTTVNVPGTTQTGTTGTGTTGTGTTGTETGAAANIGNAAAAEANTAALNAAAGNAGTTGTGTEGTGANGNEANGTGTEGNGTEAIPDEQVPQSLQDIDDEEVPAGNIDAETKKSFPMVASIGIGAGAIAALGVLLFFMIKKRRIK
ncbi:MAG: MucBP domain-containing protein [Lachnospiraceae bacterium]|nr:MucBP domain-containing protein [Lachnospiraceae bacterium]